MIMQLQEQIKAYRESKKLKVSEVSRMSGVHRASIWRFESGGDMLVSSLTKYLNALGVGLQIVLKDIEK